MKAKANFYHFLHWQARFEQVGCDKHTVHNKIQTDKT